MSDSLKDFAAGTAGGFAGKLLDYPLDTVKVLLQTQEAGEFRGTHIEYCIFISHVAACVSISPAYPCFQGPGIA